MFEIGRMPAATSRAFNHGGEGPMRTSWNRRPMYRGQPSGSSTLTGTAEERGDLTRDAVNRQQVGAVRRRLELEHGLAERQHVRERRPRFRAVVEDEDAAVVLAELELALGEDHPVRDLAAKLGLLESLPVR
jgi:hypothetical protein